MSTTVNYLYNHLIESFQHYSNDELIQLNNEIVQSNHWGSSKGTFRTAILNVFAKRGIDLSRIISKDDGFTSVLLTKVQLQENTLYPV